MSGSLARTACVSLAEALSKGPPPIGNLAVPIFAHGSLAVELYTPKGQDPQQPHDRDEAYLEDFSADFAVWVFFYGPVGGNEGKRASLNGMAVRAVKE